MTRDEYLNELRKNLQSLTIDEQNEAMQYYCDYFEDAGFDEAKVIEELGTPEEVAAKIKSDLSNTLVKKENGKSEESEDNSSNINGSGETSLYFEYSADKVKNINFSFTAAEVICISGSKYSIETRGLLQENLYCKLEGDTLVCKNMNQFQNLRFFNHVRRTGFAPRILITVPESAKLNNLAITIGAGRFETKKISLYCLNGKIEAGAGNCVVDGVYGKNMNIRCGMGNVSISGEVKGNSNIDCGMGNIKLELSGDPATYSFDSKVGLGSVVINDEKRGGFGQNYSQAKKENHLSINCGMGNVKVIIK